MNQLIGLSRQSRVAPTDLLAEASGNQDYILDYLTEEVLRQQDEAHRKLLRLRMKGPTPYLDRVLAAFSLIGRQAITRCRR